MKDYNPTYVTNFVPPDPDPMPNPEPGRLLRRLRVSGTGRGQAPDGDRHRGLSAPDEAAT